MLCVDGLAEIGPSVYANGGLHAFWTCMIYSKHADMQFFTDMLG